MTYLAEHKIASSLPSALNMATSPPNVNRPKLENCIITKQFGILQTPFLWGKKWVWNREQ